MAKPFIRVVKATRHAPHDVPGRAAVKMRLSERSYKVPLHQICSIVDIRL
jgi:hypothetical protein